MWHLKRCTGLTSHRECSDNNRALCCSEQLDTNLTNAEYKTNPNGNGPSTNDDRRKLSNCSCLWRHHSKEHDWWMKCNNYNGWCHIRKCTNLTHHMAWSGYFVADCCANIQTTAATSQSPTLHMTVTHRDLQLYIRTTPSRQRHWQYIDNNHILIFHTTHPPIHIFQSPTDHTSS